MKIEIKLENPKYCDDCPLLCGDMVDCHLYPDLNIPLIEPTLEGTPEEFSGSHFIRPEICIKERGN